MHVIVRPPGPAFASAISTHPQRDRIDPDLAAVQHAAFCDALESAGVPLVRLPAEPDLPDAPFVSDALVALGRPADPAAGTGLLVATRPGAQPRRPEVASVLEAACRLVPASVEVLRIGPPALLEGGDVVLFGDRLAIGVSARTNEAGARLLADAAERLGYRPFLCPVTDRLHLATAVTAAGPDLLVGTQAGFASLDSVGPDMAPPSVRRVLVPDEELPGANVLALGGRCFVAAGYPRATAALRGTGQDVVEVELSEFVRADGGPTCLVAIIP